MTENPVISRGHELKVLVLIYIHLMWLAIVHVLPPFDPGPFALAAAWGGRCSQLGPSELSTSSVHAAESARSDVEMSSSFESYPGEVITFQPFLGIGFPPNINMEKGQPLKLRESALLTVRAWNGASTRFLAFS